jgi:nitrite reductase/ring-hydroxylating ferredoxin subunit
MKVFFVGRCPHSGGPIYYNPKLDKLVCKWHGAQFSKSGKVLAPPAQSNLKVKKLKK